MIKKFIYRKERVSSYLALFLSISLIFNSTVFVYPQEAHNGNNNVEPTPLVEEETPDEEVEIEEPIVEPTKVEDPIIEEEEIEEVEEPVEESIEAPAEEEEVPTEEPVEESIEAPAEEEEVPTEEPVIEEEAQEEPIAQKQKEVEEPKDNVENDTDILFFVEEVVDAEDDEYNGYETPRRATISVEEDQTIRFWDSFNYGRYFDLATVTATSGGTAFNSGDKVGSETPITFTVNIDDGFLNQVVKPENWKFKQFNTLKPDRGNFGDAGFRVVRKYEGSTHGTASVINTSDLEAGNNIFVGIDGFLAIKTNRDQDLATTRVPFSSRKFPGVTPEGKRFKWILEGNHSGDTIGVTFNVEENMGTAQTVTSYLYGSVDARRIRGVENADLTDLTNPNLEFIDLLEGKKDGSIPNNSLGIALDLFNFHYLNDFTENPNLSCEDTSVDECTINSPFPDNLYVYNEFSLVTPGRENNRRYVHFPSSPGNTGEVENGRINVTGAVDSGEYRRGARLIFNAVPDAGYRSGKWTAIAIANIGTPTSGFAEIFERGGYPKTRICDDNQAVCNLSDNGRGDGVIINHEFRDPVPPQVNIQNQTTKKGVVCGYYTGPNPGDTESFIKPRTGGFDVNGTFKFRAFPSDGFPTTGSLSFSEIYDSQGRIRQGKDGDEREYRDICGDTIDGGARTLTSNLYELDSWELSGTNECRDTFNGASIQENVCILTEPIQPVTINVEATFSAIKRTVTLSPTQNGSISGTKNGEDIVSGNTYEGAGDFVFTATPVLPYTAGLWLVTSFATQSGEVIACEEGNGGNTCTIRDITGDITVSRTFTLVKTQVEISNFEYNGGADIFVTSDPALPTTPATAVNEGGSVEYTGVITYSTADSTCSVESDGTLSPISTGECTITANAPEDTTRLPNTKSITVNIVKEETQVTAAVYPSTATALDGEIEFTSAATVSPSGYDGTITYSTDSDISICEVNTTTGGITINGVGSCEIIATASQTDKYNGSSATSTPVVISKATSSIASITNSPFIFNTDGTPGAKTTLQIRLTEGDETRDYIFGGEGERSFSSFRFTSGVTSTGASKNCSFDDTTGVITVSSEFSESSSVICTFERIVIGASNKVEEAIQRDQFFHILGSKENIHITSFRYYVGTVDATSPPISVRSIPIVTASNTSAERLAAYYDDGGEITYESETPDVCTVNLDPSSENFLDITLISGGGARVNTKSCTIRATARSTNRFRGADNSAIIQVIKSDTTASISYAPVSYASDRTEAGITLNLNEADSSREYDFSGNDRAITIGEVTSFDSGTTCAFNRNSGVVTITGDLPDETNPVTPACTFTITVDATPKLNGADAETVNIVANKIATSITAPVYPDTVSISDVTVSPSTEATVASNIYSGTITYSTNSDISICEVDSTNGDITTRGEGDCEVTATASGTFNHAVSASLVTVTITKEATTSTLAYPLAYRLERVTTTEPTLTIVEEGVSRTFDPNNKTRTVVFTKEENTDTEGYCNVDSETGLVTITTDVVDAVTCSVRVNIEQTSTYGEASATFDITTSRPHYIGGETWNNEDILVTLQNNVLPPETTYTPVGQCTVDGGGDVTVTGAGDCTITIDTPADDPISLRISTLKGDLSITDPTYTSPILANDTAEGPTTRASTSYTYTGTITYSTSTPLICSIVEADGIVTPIAIGTCTVKATFGGDDNWNAKESNEVNITINGATNVVIFSYQQTSHVGGTQEITPTITINSQDLATTKATRTVTFAEIGDDAGTNACTVNAETGVVTVTGVLPEETLNCEVGVSLGANDTYIESSDGDHNAILNLTKEQKTLTTVELSYPLAYRLERITTTTPVVNIIEGGVSRVFNQATETRTVTFIEVANSDANDYCEINDSTGIVTITSDVDNEVSCVFKVLVGESDTQTSATVTTAVATSRPHYTGGETWNNEDILITLQNNVLPVNTTYTPAGQCTVDSGGAVTVTGAGECTITIDTPADDPISLRISTLKGDLLITDPTYTSPILANDSAEGPTTGASTSYTYTGTITYSTSTPLICSIVEADGIVTPIAIGTCTVTATFGGDDNWNAKESNEVNITIKGTTGAIDFSYPKTVRKTATQEITPTITINGQDLVTTKATRTVTFAEVANSDAGGYCTVDPVTGVVTIDGDVNIAVTCSVEVSVGEGSVYAAETKIADIATARPSYDTPHTWNGTPISVILQQKDTLPSGASFSSVGQCTVDGVGDVSITGAGICTVDINTQVDGIVSLTITTDKGDLITTDPVYDSPILANANGVGPTTEASTTAAGYSSNLITYSTSTPLSCSVVEATGVVTPNIVGTCTITASFGGDLNWNAKTSNSVNIDIQRATTTATFSYPSTYRLGTSATVSPELTITEGNAAPRTFDPLNKTRIVTFSEVANSDTNNHCSVNSNTGELTIRTSNDFNDSVTCNIQVSIGQTGTYSEVTETFEITALRPNYNTSHTWANTAISVPLQNNVLAPATTYTAAGQCTVDSSGDVIVSGAGTCTVTIDTPTDDPIDIIIETAKGELVFIEPVFPTEAKVNGGPILPLQVAEPAPASSGYTGLISYDQGGEGACRIDAVTGIITPLAPGACRVIADFEGDDNWNVPDTFNIKTIQIIRATTSDPTLNYPLAYRLERVTTTEPTLTIVEEGTSRTFDPNNKSRTVVFTEVTGSDSDNYCEVHRDTGVVTITTDSTDAVTCSVRVNIEEDNTYGAASTTFDITTSRPYYVGGSSWNNENISAPLQNKDILPVNTAYTRKSGQCTVDVSGDVTITGAGICTITIDTPTDNPVDLTIETAKGTLITTDPAYDSPILATATATNPTTEASTIPEYTGAITYSTSTDTICSVDATSGAVTPKIIGTCTITASFASDINWNEKELTPVDITVNGATNVVVFSYQQTSHVGGTQEITPNIEINGENLITAKTSRTVTFSELGDDLDANACTVNAETGVITITGTLASENLDCSVEVSIGSHTRYLESTHNATLQISKVAKTPTVVAFSYPLEYRLGTTTSTTPVVTIKDGDDPARTFDSVSETRTVTFSEVANSDTNNYCEVDTNTGVVTVTADIDDEVSCVFSVSVDETDSQTSVNLSTTIATSRPYYVGGSSWNNTPIVVELQNKDILPVDTTYTHKSGQCTVAVSGDASITGAGTCTVTIDTPTDDPIDLTIETAKGTLIITNPVYLQTLPVNAGETNPTTEASTIPEYTGAITYSTNTTDVCSVDATSGAVTPKIIGTCTITASFSTDINWNTNESAESSINITRAENIVNFTYPGITHTGDTQTVSPTITINSEDLATTSRTVTFTEVANTDTNNYCTVDSSTGVVTITGTITEIAVTCEVEVSIDLDGRYLASTHQATLNISGLTIDFSGNGRIDTTDAIVFYIYAIFEGIGFAPVDNQKILESVLREEVNFTIEGSPRLSDSAEDVYNLLKSYSDSNAIDFSGNGRTDTTDAIVFYIYAIFEGIGFAPIDNQKILDSVLREEVNFTIEGSPRLSDSAEDVYNLLKGYSR